MKNVKSSMIAVALLGCLGLPAALQGQWGPPKGGWGGWGGGSGGTGGVPGKSNGGSGSTLSPGAIAGLTGEAAQYVVSFDTSYNEDRCDDVTIVLVADEKTKTEYNDRKFAEKAREEGWSFYVYHVSEDDGDEEEFDEDEPISVFETRFTGDLQVDHKAKVGDFVVLDDSANFFGKTRNLSGVASLVGKMERMQEKLFASQAKLYDRVQSAIEKDDTAQAVRLLERIAKEGVRGDMWDEAEGTYDELIDEGYDAFEDAIDAGDVDALKSIDKIYGKAFTKCTSAAIKMVLSEAKK